MANDQPECSDSRVGMYLDANRAQPGAGVSDFSVERYQHACSFLESDYRLVVDVGCNTGVGAAVMRKCCQRARLEGIEIVPERAEEARKHFDRVHECLASDMPFSSGAVDAIVSLEVIEHLTRDDALKFLCESKRVLRDKGRIILSTPNSDYVKLKILRRSVLDDPSHLTQFSPKSLADLLCECGFQVHRVEGTGRVSRYLGRKRYGLALFGSFMVVGIS